MKKAVNNNLVPSRFSSSDTVGEAGQASEQEGLYGRVALALLKCANESQLREVGDRLTHLADQALGLRHAEVVEQVSNILINSPLPRQYRSIGQYYQAINIQRRGEPDRARAILETLAESRITPLKYRARAIKDIGSSYYESGDYNEALRFFVQAIHAASPPYGWDLDAVTTTQWGIAIIRGILGDNKGALAVLEGLSSPIRLLASKHPSFFYSYANSLAVEYGELGRFAEAKNALRIALATPFAYQLPGIRSTAEEIEQKAHRASPLTVALSTVSFDSDEQLQAGVEDEITNGSVISIGRNFFDDAAPQMGAEVSGTESDDRSRSLTFKEPFSLLPFPNLFADSSEAEKSYSAPQINILHFFRLSVGQKRSLVMEIARDRNTSAEILDKMLEVAGVIGLGEDEKPVYKTRTINLEHRGFLQGRVSLWMQGEVSPDDFAAVISAIRDCNDTLRRNIIIDQIISHGFQASPQQIKSEEKWRSLVEVQPQDLLEDEAYLEDKISLWINGEMTAEDLASVLFAVRDCANARRRNSLLNRMIGYAYLQIACPLESEREWRKRVEASFEPAHQT